MSNSSDIVEGLMGLMDSFVSGLVQTGLCYGSV
jgi:hypothetical protein